MNIDISNAHCGPRIQFPDHAWLRVVYVPKDCLRQFCSCENDERRETCRRARAFERQRMVCVWGGRESFSGRAPLFGPTTTPPRRRPTFSLDARARARAFCQIKERLRRTSDNWTFAKEREIFRRSPLRVVRNEAEPFCVLSRAGGMILARARDAVWIAEPTACPSPRGLSSVRVFFLNTHLGTGTTRRVLRFVVARSRLGFVLLSPPLCDNRRSYNRWRGRGSCVPSWSKRPHHTQHGRVPLFTWNVLKTQNG